MKRDGWRDEEYGTARGPGRVQCDEERVRTNCRDGENRGNAERGRDWNAQGTTLPESSVGLLTVRIFSTDEEEVGA